MRLASFNVENLFSRAKAFDAEDRAAAKKALDAFAAFNALIAEPKWTTITFAVVLAGLPVYYAVFRNRAPNSEI